MFTITLISVNTEISVCIGLSDECLLTGATGYIGHHLVEKLLADGHVLTLCLRNVDQVRSQFPDCHIAEGDFTTDHTPEDWLPRLKGIDIVINAVGIISQNQKQSFEALHTKAPIALFAAAKEADVRHIIQISALGADDEAESAYHLSKKAADDALADMKIPSTIFRPSIVYGEDAASWSLFQGIAALPIIGLIENGRQKLRPIHIDDLIDAIVISAEKSSGEKLVIDAVGATEISFKELLVEMHNQTSLHKAFLFSVPSWLASLGAKIASLFGARMINAETIKMLMRGNTSDVKPFTQTFGFKPRPLEFATLKKAKILQTRTYFIPSLLRISIAFVWIWTAIVSAFLYPVTDSLVLLAKTGITGTTALFALYGAAALDLILGIAVLTRFMPRLITFVQLILIAIYSALLTIFIPELWLHPFGPLLKNLPMVAAIIVLYAMEEGKS